MHAATGWPRLPLRLLPQDLVAKFSVGQQLVVREKGSRFACEVVAVVGNFIGVWYLVRFEGSDQLEHLPQHVLSLQRSEIPAPVKEKPPSSVPVEAPEKSPKKNKRLSSSSRKLARKPTYAEEQEAGQQLTSSDMESEFSQEAPRIRRSSLSERPEVSLTSPESLSESEISSDASSWLERDIIESPERKRPKRKDSENLPPPAADEKATVRDSNPGPKKIRKNAKVEYAVNTGAKFVHRSSSGGVECVLIGKKRDETGCWFYEIRYERGSSIKNVPAWKLEKADIMAAYRNLANSQTEESQQADRKFAGISMDVGDCAEWIDEEVRRNFQRTENWDAQLGKARLETWLEAVVFWASGKVDSKLRLPLVLRVLGRIGNFFLRKNPGHVHFLHFTADVSGELDELKSENVSLALKCCFAIALSGESESSCAPAALRDALKAIFPTSGSRETRDAWTLTGLLLVLSCKKTPLDRRANLTAAFFTALPVFFFEDGRGREFVLGVLASVASAGRVEIPKLKDDKLDLKVLLPTAVDILGRAKPNSDASEVEAAWRFVALAPNPNDPELTDMSKLGFFGWSREDERSQMCPLRGYEGLNFQAAMAKRREEDEKHRRRHREHKSYDVWKEERLIEQSDRKKRRPDNFLVFLKRELEPILIGGTSFFEDKFTVDNEDTLNQWAERKFWCSEIATKIITDSPSKSPEDAIRKRMALTYLEECRRLMMDTLQGNPLDICAERLDICVRDSLRNHVIPALQYMRQVFNS